MLRSSLLRRYLYLSFVTLATGGATAACQAFATADMPASTSALPVTDKPAALADTVASLEYLLGKFSPRQEARFVRAETPYTGKEGMYLRRETYAAFRRMHAAAAAEGINLQIVSSTRTFEQQTAIWNRKWDKLAATVPQPVQRASRILQYSAMPGASRHHWGTDIDLQSVEGADFLPGGPHAAAYRWLSQHGAEYGFYQPYTAGRPAGYEEERWHWSYLPLAGPFLRQYQQLMGDARFAGFRGAETAASLRILENYALGVDVAVLNSRPVLAPVVPVEVAANKPK